MIPYETDHTLAHRAYWQAIFREIREEEAAGKVMLPVVGPGENVVDTRVSPADPEQPAS